MIEQAVLIGLAGWRLASLVTHEAGPLDVFLRFRRSLGIEHHEGEPIAWPENVLAQALSCVWCLGVWTTAAMYGVWQLEPVLVMVAAGASILVLVEKWVRP